MSAARQMHVRLEHVPDCPLVERVRARLRQALTATGVSARVDDVEGDYPSPTLLIDGIDAATGQPTGGALCCRLELPTTEQITTALTRRHDPDEA
jgi:hypothetical protein